MEKTNVPIIGIIGGTGLADVLTDGRREAIDTPFGPTSAPVVRGQWHGVDIAFISRHGEGHVHPPSAVPYRANIFALRTLGVTHILASGATGSLREEYRPGELVIADQVIDKTFRRASSFFDDRLAVHVEFARPFCPTLRTALLAAARQTRITVHDGGTYVCMEGPQFSTVAEADMHRAWGGDLIGMTCMPEAKLAREAEICYALLALPTDYDCWRPHDPETKQENLLAEIMGNLKSASQAAVAVMEAAVKQRAGTETDDCPCRHALELAIWSDKSRVDRDLVTRLGPLLSKYF
jgi:5'-methylthioadenosine phosphorylase